MQTMQTPNKRRGERYNKSFYVNVLAFCDDPVEKSIEFNSKTRDVSSTGAYIYSNRDLLFNMSAVISWIFPSDPETKARGFISRIDDEGFAVMFEEPQEWIHFV